MRKLKSRRISMAICFSWGLSWFVLTPFCFVRRLNSTQAIRVLRNGYGVSGEGRYTDSVHETNMKSIIFAVLILGTCAEALFWGKPDCKYIQMTCYLKCFSITFAKQQKTKFARNTRKSRARSRSITVNTRHDKNRLHWAKVLRIPDHTAIVRYLARFDQ